MEIVVVGINHKTAPVELREQLSFSEKQVELLLQELDRSDDIGECVILSTCNRTEIYALAGSSEQAWQAAARYYQAERGLEPSQIETATYRYSGQEAVKHLFRVSAGLDSMILGETQVLGQVKGAYELADSCGTIGKVLHALFRQALVCGKRVHSETGINQNAASVSYAAVKLARDIFGQLEGCSVLIIGAGKMSELALRHLHSQGCREILIINRTRERAESLAGDFCGQIYNYDSMEECLKKADIIISSTGAPHFVVQKSVIARTMRARKNRPLFLIDIAVPRDLDPAINDIDNAYLYDIDDLQAVVDANKKEREAEARKAERIVSEEVSEYQIWFKTLNVVPLITALRQKAESIRQEELANMVSTRLGKLGLKEQKAVDNLTKLIINRILREPVLRIKEFAVEGRSEVYVASLCQLFDLEESLFPDEENLPEKMINRREGKR